MLALSKLVKSKRKDAKLTQEEFAERAGVALTVIRKIEQGKTNLNLDKVNLVLRMFGHELSVEEIDKFRPETFSAVVANLYDRGLIDKSELDSLLQEHISGRQFNANGMLKDNRPVFVLNELKRIIEQNGLHDPYNPNYLKI
jgi:y4mF family transcriptional regulator